MAIYYKLSDADYARIESVALSLFAYSTALGDKRNVDYHDQATSSLLYLLHDQLDIVVKNSHNNTIAIPDVEE